MFRAFHIIRFYFSLGWKLFIENRKQTNKLINYLNQILNKNEFSFSKNQIKRIHNYTSISFITNDWFSTLRGYPPTKTEKQRALFIGTITPLVDDLNDEQQMDTASIWHKAVETNECNNENIILIRYLYQLIEKTANTAFIEQIKVTLKAQNDSIEQLKEQQLIDEKIKKIIYNVGASSTLLFRLNLEHSLQQNEKEAIQELGYLLQLINDMFSIYDDLKNKQQTLYTNAKDFGHLYQEYKVQIYKVIELFQQLNYKPKQIKNFLYKVSLIMARGMVCSKQLVALEKIKGKGFKLNQCSRKELICDMEKMSNIVKSMKYSIRLAKKIDF